jgi:hypothetical protein
MKAYLFGAGSSRGTLGPSCPVATKFGQELARSSPSWQSQFPNLKNVVQHLGCDLAELSLEKIWTWIDYYYKLAQPAGAALPRAEWLREAELDLKRALLSVYGRKFETAADKLPTTNYTLADLLSRVETGDVLISFNYDTLVERLARRFKCKLQAFDHELRSDVVNFAKPHGSTSWCLDHGLKSLTYRHLDGAPLLDSMLEGDVSTHKTPLLLGTVPIKSELISEVQISYKVPDVYRVVMAQWKAIIEAVRGADTLIVVGYSFPEEDQYGRFLFQEAIRGRDSKKSLKVEFYEKVDRRAEVAKAILETFPFRRIQLEWKDKVRAPLP